MNPATAAPPTQPRTLTDVTRPPAAHLAEPAAAATTNIVENIPMHAPVQPASPVVKEDEELDTLMRDIGHELKQADRQTTKKRFSLFGRKHPAPAAKPVSSPAQPAHPAATAAPAPRPVIPVPKPQTAAAVAPAVKARPPKTVSAPLGVIFMTVLVTGALIAAAIYSYK